MAVKNSKLNVDLKNIDPEFILKSLSQMNQDFMYSSTKDAWTFYNKRNFVDALAISQVLLDRTWEELNTGYWKDVDITWRYLYTFVSCLKSISLYELGDMKSALLACDMGLLMGAPIFENVLSTIAVEIDKSLQMKRKQIDDCICEGNSNDERPPAKLFKKYTQSKINDQFKITMLDSPSLITFQEKHMNLEVPVVIKNSFNHWPAMGEHRWSIEYIKRVAGDRTVPVEIGEKYTSTSWTQKLITVSEFIDTYIMKRNNMGYLAQHQLFEQIPTLRNDIMIPDYCCLSDQDNFDTLIHAWYGPEGTVSPLHHDPYHNLLAQVVGSKYIRLYDRRLSEAVYPHVDTILDNTSQVDVEDVDVTKFPKFIEAPYYECILTEGEMLYIPQKWWHYVRSLSTSFSVSFWWK